MNTCPHCGSLSVTIDKAGNHWFSCGSANRFRSQTCVDREPLFKALQAAKARIEALEKAGDTMSKALTGTEGQTHWQWLAEAHEADLLWRKAKEVNP